MDNLIRKKQLPFRIFTGWQASMMQLQTFWSQGFFLYRKKYCIFQELFCGWKEQILLRLHNLTPKFSLYIEQAALCGWTWCLCAFVSGIQLRAKTALAYSIQSSVRFTLPLPRNKILPNSHIIATNLHLSPHKVARRERASTQLGPTRR